MKDISKLAVQSLLESVYRPLLDAWKDAWGSQVEPYLQLLQNVRKKEVQDRELKANTIKMLGFDLNVDYFTDDQLTTLISTLVSYSTHRNDTFFKLIGFVKNVPFEVIPLWTKDYKDFSENNLNVQSMAITEGGEWYPTNHIKLKYDMSDGTVTREEVEDIFYELAPAKLVLHSVAALVNSNRQPVVNVDGKVINKDTSDTESQDVQLPNPDDYPYGVDDPDYIDAINKLKERLNALYWWQCCPGASRIRIASEFQNTQMVKTNTAITCGHIYNELSDRTLYFPCKTKYLFNYRSNGIYYSRNYRLTQWVKNKKQMVILEPDQIYREENSGLIFSTGENTNKFVDATNPITQSNDISAGDWTIWCRGFDGHLDVRFPDETVINIPVGQSYTFHTDEEISIDVEVLPGIVFVQVEPNPYECPGIYTFGNQTGVKGRDLFYTTVDETTYHGVFNFKLYYSDFISQQSRFKTVFSANDFRIDMKLGTQPDRLDTEYRFYFKKLIVRSGFISDFLQSDGFCNIVFAINNKKIIIRMQNQDLEYNTDISKLWFGSNLGFNNADIHIKKIIMFEGEF